MAERLMNVLRGAGSILDIWPVPQRFDELSPHDAEEMFRRSWLETGAALQRAMNEVDLGPEPEEETQEEATAQAATEDSRKSSRDTPHRHAWIVHPMSQASRPFRLARPPAPQGES